MVTCEEVIRHIRECEEEKCSQLRQEHNKAVRDTEKVELLVDKEDGLLPFSC